MYLKHIVYITLCMILACYILIQCSSTAQEVMDCDGTNCPQQNNVKNDINDANKDTIPEKLEKLEQQLQSITNAVENMVNLFHNQLNSNSDRSFVLPPQDCQDVYLRGMSSSGVYTIAPKYGFGSLQVFCDMEDGAWTVFQKRFDGSVDFNQEWSEYENGFGSAEGEYWLGLRNINALTNVGTWQLRIDMESFDGDTAYALYDTFAVGNTASSYKLRVGEYSGTAGNPLNYYDYSFKTSTKNSYCSGGWWTNSHNSVCSELNSIAASSSNSNLNGLYLGPTGNSYKGNIWKSWKHSQSLKKSVMKMRRVKY